MRPYTLESASDTNLLCLCLDITEDMAAKNWYISRQAGI